MDVVLDVFDTLAFDRIYASLLPVVSRPVEIFTQNGTYTSMQQLPIPYEYVPASKWLPYVLEPSELINMSRMLRNDPVRQAISLYIITAYVGQPDTFVIKDSH